MLSKNTENLVYHAVESGELEIDSEGRIWRVACRRWNRWTKQTETLPCTRRRAENNLGGYLQVRVMIDNKRSHALAHRLIWLHFHGEIPPTLTINHKNGNKQDNRPENLELATYSQQARHRNDVLGKGRKQNGEMNSMHKLTDAQVVEIRELRAGGMRLAEIGKRYKVSYQAVSKIARRERRG